MRKVLSFLCLLAISSTAYGQSKQSDWANLKALLPGQEIQIIEANSNKHTGHFVALSDSAITFSEASSEKSLLKPDVRIVKARKPDHRLRNTLIGLGVGAGGGAAFFAGAWSTTGWNHTAAAGGVGAAVGGVIGTVVGVAVPTHRFGTIYKARPQ